MLIEEGRLIESPCPHCGHLERRAFGEWADREARDRPWARSPA
jgi:hypothetical protein